VVGIPAVADQRINMARAVLAGYGLKIYFNNITTESLTWAIQEAIESPNYVVQFNCYFLLLFVIMTSQINGRLGQFSHTVLGLPVGGLKKRTEYLNFYSLFFSL
jgi:hypothetical protein